MSGGAGRLDFEVLASPARCSADGCELAAIGLRFGRPWCLSHAPSYDPVGRPRHYQSASGLEVIDVVESFGLGFLLGNVVKYVCRAQRKNGVEDLRKARWYLDRAIEKGVTR